MEKPIKLDEKGEVVTVGDHIKQKRLKLGLLQKDVAIIIGVSEDTITCWENDRVSNPEIRYMPKIIGFLGYNPISINTSTLAGKIYQFRALHGLTYKVMGKLIGVDGSTIASWEKNENNPTRTTRLRIEKLLRSK